MYPWIDSRQSLPDEHERVCFIVMQHVQPLTGRYEKHHFHSRWGAWEETQVPVWRQFEDPSSDGADRPLG
jgi:hypothetical protein